LRAIASNERLDNEYDLLKRLIKRVLQEVPALLGLPAPGRSLLRTYVLDVDVNARAAKRLHRLQEKRKTKTSTRKLIGNGTFSLLHTDSLEQLHQRFVGYVSPGELSA
jgi:hypothetical protein